MKTRERILHTSLELFNLEGEPRVTTVDIANEMDISPGNLYYHFKGKEVIVDELFGRFESQMQEILGAPARGSIKTEDCWFYLYVVFEEIFNYRFLYHDITGIMLQYERIQRRFKRLLTNKNHAMTALCASLEESGLIAFNDDDTRRALINQVVIILIYWVNYQKLMDSEEQDDLMMHKGVYQVMLLIVPYLQGDSRVFLEECGRLYQEAMQSAQQNA
jgi:AcrR family transcriptional regulator